MKLKLIKSALIGAFIVLASTVAASAQTNAAGQTMGTNAAGQVVPVNSSIQASNFLQYFHIPQPIQNAFSALGQGLNDAQPYIGNKVFAIEAGTLYNSGDKKGKFGGFLDVTVPISQQVGVGIAGGYLNGHWLDASVNVQLGTTISLPYVGDVFGYIADGPEYDFQAKSLGAYNFAGAIKKFPISKTSTFTIGAAVGNISTLPGTTIAAGGSWTATF